MYMRSEAASVHSNYVSSIKAYEEVVNIHRSIREFFLMWDFS